MSACASSPHDNRITLTFSGSAVGAEGVVFDRQLARFSEAHPDLRVVRQPTPDAADERHQLYVQWLNAGVDVPDVLQIDVVWTPELAAAGWIAPLDAYAPQVHDVFASVLTAYRWRDALYALPLFVDVGMLYVRSDLVPAPPRTLNELSARGAALVRAGAVRYGYVWTGARYEGLTTVFLETVGAFGGRLLDANGAVRVDSPEAVRALTFMRDCLREGVVPEAALAWQEEQARFAFQNGEAAFMRNWPYALALLRDPETSRVAPHVAIAPLPATPEGHPTAALGGAALALNAHSAHPRAAYALAAYLSAPAQMIERAHMAGQFPARASLYTDEALGASLGVSASLARTLVEDAVPRPITPLYAELSAALQANLHRALSGQVDPDEALRGAASDMRRVLAQAAPSEQRRSPIPFLLALLIAIGLASAMVWRWRHKPRATPPPDERIAFAYVAPALFVIGAVGLFPLVWTFVDSFYAHDLRMPWRGRAFVGLGNYAEIAQAPRFAEALAHTGVFVAASVATELLLGTVLALGLHHVVRARGLVRTTVLLPWAIPTVVAALVWRFLFADVGVVNAALTATGIWRTAPAWFSHPLLAWVPLLLADIWKTTPFVALLLLAGLQTIPDRLYEAARTDGARTWQSFVEVTLPLLRPTLLVVLVFRTLDAFRVFDLVYVLTGGGPGTATEPIALYTFASLMQTLRFGYGAALSVLIFVIALALALAYVRLLGGTRENER